MEETINGKSIWGSMWFSGDWDGVGMAVGLHDLCWCMFLHASFVTCDAMHLLI